jgi:hypothetical protein
LQKDHLETLEEDGTGSELCPLVIFGITSIEFSGSSNRVLVVIILVYFVTAFSGLHIDFQGP